MAGFNGFGGANMQQLLKQAQKMQEQMQKDREELEMSVFDASSGGGMVEVKMNGKRELVAIMIKPEVVDPDDIEMLEDLLLAALKDANSKAKEIKDGKMGAFGNLGGLM